MNKWLMWAVVILVIILLYFLLGGRGESRVISVQPDIDPYERIIYAQAHNYHGILFSTCPGDGEPYFYRNGQKCKLLSTIRGWRVVL